MKFPSDRPACDCGHAFEKDPRWFHLDGCVYRESFRLPDGVRYRFQFVYMGDLDPVEFAKALHEADRRNILDYRSRHRIPRMRAQYRRKRRYW